MKKKTEKEFKAVEFMRNVRDELSTLYNTDKERYFKEIREAMENFKARQKKVSTSFK